MSRSARSASRPNPRPFVPAPAVVDVIIPSAGLLARRLRRAAAMIHVIAVSPDLLLRADLREALAELADDVHCDAARLRTHLLASGDASKPAIGGGR